MCYGKDEKLCLCRLCVCIIGREILLFFKFYSEGKFGLVRDFVVFGQCIRQFVFCFIVLQVGEYGEVSGRFVFNFEFILDDGICLQVFFEDQRCLQLGCYGIGFVFGFVLVSEKIILFKELRFQVVSQKFGFIFFIYI